MQRSLYSITEAARIAGRSRSTLTRWVAADRLRKKKGGMVSLVDVERCKAEWRTGRPGGYVSLPGYHIGSGAALQVAAPFIAGEGLRALRTALRVVVLHYTAARRDGSKNTHKIDALRKILLDAHEATVGDGEQALEQHERQVQRRSQNSISRGITGSHRRVRKVQRALESGKKPPRTYRQDRILICLTKSITAADDPNDDRDSDGMPIVMHKVKGEKRPRVIRMDAIGD